MKHIKSYKLFELHYTDIFPETFELLRKKYLKQDITKLYVQFTNFKNDILDRTSHGSPDHYDPVGNYAYPMSYVLKYPADLWYGMNTKYLRVLQKSESCNTLFLSSINSEEKCIFYAMKLNNEWRGWMIKEMIEKIKKHHRNRLGLKNSGYWGRMFFQILQNDLSSEPNNEGNFPIRDSNEQTSMLLNGGWNAIEDDGKKDTTAIINSREPEQICFLDRSAFKVVEIINLHNTSTEVDTTYSPDKTLTRKWVAEILNILGGDKIKEVSNKIFYSVKGREIFIEFLKPESFYDRELFQKFHKEYKLSDPHFPHIVIQTEKGNIDYRTNNEKSFNKILKDIEERWNHIKNNETIPDWKPRSISLKKEIEEKERHAQWEKEKAEDHDENMKNLPKFIDKLKEWILYLNVDFRITPLTSIKLCYIEIFESIAKACRFRHIKNTIESVKEQIEIVESGKHDSEDDIAFYYLGKEEILSKDKFVAFMKLMLLILEELGKTEDMFFYQRFYSKKFDKVELKSVQV